jgi:hypothetical protein
MYEAAVPTSQKNTVSINCEGNPNNVYGNKHRPLQHRQCMHNVKLLQLRITFVAVETQQCFPLCHC